MKLVLVCMIVLFLLGCAGKEVIVKEVQVPVPVPCPKPPEVQPPELPKVSFTSPGDSESVVCLDEENARNLLIFVSRLIMYIKQLEEALSVYK